MATTALGRLTLDLAVRLSEFSEGMSRAERETQDRTDNMSASVSKFKDTLTESLSGTPIGSAVDSLVNKLGDVKEAFGDNGISGAAKVGAAAVITSVVAIGAGLVTLTLQAAESDKQLALMAARANTTVKEIQVLSYASSQLGIEQDKLVDILADVKEKLGEFSLTGGGGAADFFETLENNTKMSKEEIEAFSKQLNSVSGSEALQLINDKMVELNLSATESRFIYESLGSDLTDLMGIYRNGGEDLRVYEEALYRAGVLRTEEAIEQSRILSAQTEASKLQFQGLQNELTSHTAPAINAVANYFSDASRKATGFGASALNVGSVISGVAKVIIGFASVVNMALISFGGLMDQFYVIGQTGTAFINADGWEAKIQVLENSGARFAAAGRNTMQQIANEAERAANAINKTGIGSVNTGNLSRLEKALYNQSKEQTRGAGASVNAYVMNQREEADKAAAASAKASAKAASSSAKASKDAAKASQLLREYVVGGKSYTTVPEGRYGAKRGYGGHAGLDLSTPRNTQVYAPEGGKYTFANTPNGGGGRIATLVGDSGMKYRFLHLESTSIPSGSRVEMGSPIAKSGNSGRRASGKPYDVHLHMEVYDSKGRRLDPTNMKISGNAKQQVDVASIYDAENREAEQAAKERERKLLEQQREEEARKRAGQNAIKANLSEIDRINLDAKEAKEEANRTLYDRPKELIKVLENIEAETKKKIEDIRNKILDPFLTEYDKLDIIRDNKIFDAIQTFGKDAEEVKQVTAEAIREREASAKKLEQDVLLPYMNELEKLDIQKDRMILDVVEKFGADSPIANKAIEGIMKAYNEDKASIEWANNEAERARQELNDTILKSMTDSVKASAISSEDSVAKLNMLPEDYLKWRASRDKSNDYENLFTTNNDRINEINAKDEKGDFLLDKERRDKLLLEAHEEYLIKKQDLDNQYAVKERDLAKDTAMAKLDLEQSNVDAMGSLAGVLFGQQSAAARAAFLVSKAYTLQKILLDKGAAISSAWANTNGDVWQKAAAAAQAAIANGAAAEIVNQVVVPTFSGIAHGGMDYIPKESTFLLDKGERVLSPRQNKDLTSFLENTNKSSNGDTNITINIDNNGNANMNSDNASKISRELSLQVKNIVEATLRKEKRQGGML